MKINRIKWERNREMGRFVVPFYFPKMLSETDTHTKKNVKKKEKEIP